MSTPLTKLVLAPINIKIAVESDFINFVKKKLLEYHKEPMANHDAIEIMMLGQPVKFLVAEIEPRSGRFTEDTELWIKGEPLHPPKQEKDQIARVEEVDRLLRAISLLPTFHPHVKLLPSSSPQFQDTFVTKIISGGRITIPEALREIYELKEGDILKIGFKLLKQS